MSLNHDIKILNQNLRANIPQESLAVMEQATQDLLNQGLVEKAKRTGDMLPEFELPNALGQSVSSQTLLLEGPLVLSFYRGSWCPYCNLEVRALQQILPELKELGAQLVAITPEQPDHSLSLKEKHALSFEVLTDQNNQYAKKLGLVFELPSALVGVYEKIGIQVAQHNGTSRHELPIPATYIVESSGRINYAFLKADYRERMEPQDILERLRQLKK